MQAGRKKFLKQPLLPIKTFGDTFLQTTLPIYKKKMASEKGFLGEKK